MNSVDIEVKSTRDESGVWKSACPFCGWSATGFLHGFCKNQLQNHLNEKHYEGRVGNA
jgi:hypothetical protein